MSSVPDAILALTGEHADWSNFGTRPVSVFGRTWPTSEHPFQAAKFLGVPGGMEWIEQIVNAPSPREAKRLGSTREVRIRPDWDLVSFGVMTLVVLRKFSQHDDLRAALTASAPAVIVEGNGHGDDLWGAVWVAEQSVARRTVWNRKGGRALVGRNLLGKALMLARADLGGLR